MKQRFALIFVCQQGRLEAQAALLAASLRRFVRFDYELIAAIPTPGEQWGKPDPRTLAFLAKIGVRTVCVTNGIDPGYAIGNKVACLSVATDAKKLILIDSDMLLMRDWEEDPRFAIGFNARPASTASFTSDDAHWAAVYAACGAPPLPGCVAATYSGELIAPYFNAGFVAVPAGIGFGDVWLDCCRKIDGIDGLPNKRPYLDQIALSPAAARLGLQYDCLDERYNHPINFKPLPEDGRTLFCHYHDPMTLAREPAAVGLTRSLMEAHGELREILAGDPEWKDIISPAGAPLAERGLDLVIAGIPRSGTSLLCNLLHRHENCVVLNEPQEIAPALVAGNMFGRPPLPWAMARFYRDIRRDVLLGKPIRNKLTNGQVTEDTARENQVASYVPVVRGGDFVLGVKATIAFLSRLLQLRQMMPGSRFVACVRNPFDTIASWKTSFPHLCDADIRGRTIGHPADEGLTGAQRAELARIEQLPEVAFRRAAWWRYLAELILDSVDDVTLVRYEELVGRPSQTIEEIVRGGNPGELTGAIEPSSPRAKVDVLDQEDVQAIRSLCSDAAIRLGVYRETP
ncbi:MAG: sulfotransferase [Tepidisphaeraceae bacterium]|jgi:hypothetical protein